MIASDALCKIVHRIKTCNNVELLLVFIIRSSFLLLSLRLAASKNSTHAKSGCYKCATTRNGWIQIHVTSPKTIKNQYSVVPNSSNKNVRLSSLPSIKTWRETHVSPHFFAFLLTSHHLNMHSCFPFSTKAGCLPTVRFLKVSLSIYIPIQVNEKFFIFSANGIEINRLTVLSLANLLIFLRVRSNNQISTIILTQINL